MKKLIVSLLFGFVVLTGSSAVFAQPRTSAHVSHAALPAAAPACAETGLIGAALQENKLFCVPIADIKVYGTCNPLDVEDGGIVYTAAIGAANNHVIVGAPTSCAPSNDWPGLPIIDVEFSRGLYHAEFHGDNVVRIYRGDTNARVYP